VKTEEEVLLKNRGRGLVFEPSQVAFFEELVKGFSLLCASGSDRPISLGDQSPFFAPGTLGHISSHDYWSDTSLGRIISGFHSMIFYKCSVGMVLALESFSQGRRSASIWDVSGLSVEIFSTLSEFFKIICNRSRVIENPLSGGRLQKFPPHFLIESSLTITLIKPV
jgi:hypothetical protein